jgi:hypothetical protein
MAVNFEISGSQVLDLRADFAGLRELKVIPSGGITQHDGGAMT